jgi:translation initiation factor IF-2
VTSKAVLDKSRAEGLDIKNHMATLSAGLEATIREWFSESSRVSAVEVADHVDLDAEKQKRAHSRRRRGEGAVEDTVIVEAEAPAVGAEEPEAPASAPVAGAPPVEAVAVAETAAGEAAPAPAPVVVEVEAALPSSSAPAPSAEAGVSAETAPEAPPVPQAAVASPASPPEAAAPPEAKAAGPAKGQEKPKPDRPSVKPAGPQVVPTPAKLTGPRVVRVEKPDFAPAPRRREPLRPPPPGGPAAGPVVPAAPRGVRKPGTPGEEEEGKKKAKRRSPRRRGGRSADSGEKLVEWREKDLAERSQRLAAAGGGLRRHRTSFGRGGGSSAPGERAALIEVEEPVTVKKLSAATGLKASEIIRKLMGLGTMVTVNEVLTTEMIEMAMADYDIELSIKKARTAETEFVKTLADRPLAPMEPRAPVVTFLGHVDHGKTSLLDRIRNEAVAAGEAGGITQHMGAYRFDMGEKHVVFLDTPGHEAFTAMRSRGANMTDVVVLVVAADDGVMPQTVEALSHAKAAKVPIVVAMNKIDLPGANEMRVLGQLAEQGLSPREWGGSTEVIRTSAVTGQGIADLVEVLSLEAELLELKAEREAPASGYVIEGEMDPNRGPLARLLVLNGTLKLGDVLLAGSSFGTARQMMDDKGRPLAAAGPATPVEVSGLDGVPEAGDKFHVASDPEQARGAAEDRRQRARAQQLAAGPKMSVENLLSRIEAGEVNEVPVIIKADVQGSIEALVGSLQKLSTAEVKVNVLHAAVGGISTGDVTLAEAAGAIIVGFNAVPDSSARQLAEAKGIQIRLYRIIYNVIDDMRKIMEEGLAPEVREETKGRAEIRQVFKISRVGAIAGCIVTDGVVNRNSLVRITRNNIVVADERTLESLKRFKDDVREVRAGMECGLRVAGYEDLKESDVLEFYQKVEVARKL